MKNNPKDHIGKEALEALLQPIKEWLKGIQAKEAQQADIEEVIRHNLFDDGEDYEGKYGGLNELIWKLGRGQEYLYPFVFFFEEKTNDKELEYVNSLFGRERYIQNIKSELDNYKSPTKQELIKNKEYIEYYTIDHFKFRHRNSYEKRILFFKAVELLNSGKEELAIFLAIIGKALRGCAPL